MFLYIIFLTWDFLIFLYVTPTYSIFKKFWVVRLQESHSGVTEVNDSADIIKGCTNRNLMKLVLKQQYFWDKPKVKNQKALGLIFYELNPRPQCFKYSL